MLPAPLHDRHPCRPYDHLTLCKAADLPKLGVNPGKPLPDLKRAAQADRPIAQYHRGVRHQIVFYRPMKPDAPGLPPAGRARRASKLGWPALRLRLPFDLGLGFARKRRAAWRVDVLTYHRRGTTVK